MTRPLPPRAVPHRRPATRRTRALRALTRAAAALALTGAGLAVTAQPAVADPQPMGRCTTSSGVVLAVDFSHWGGPVYRACGTTPTTGYELLNQGGWRTTGTGHDGPAFVCRIGYSGHRGGTQFPTPEQDDCVLTPPASAYWSYWHADPGADDWEYSQLGAMLYEPEPGSVDLWTFGGTDIGGTEGRPRVTPDQLRAHNTRPQGDTDKPPSTDPAPPLPPDVDRGPRPDRPATPGPDQPSRRPAATPSKAPRPGSPAPTGPSASASSTASAGAVAPAPSAGTRVVDAAPAADAGHDPGSVVPVVTGVGMVVVIGAAAGYLARRRRAG